MRSPILIYFLGLCFLMLRPGYAADPSQPDGKGESQAPVPATSPSAIPSSIPSFIPSPVSSPAPTQEESQSDGKMDVESPNDSQYVNLRDPFKRPEAVPAQQVEKVTPKTVLEGFQLSQIRVVGVFTWPDNARAMVIDPQGGSHFVKKGTKIGTHEGEVIEVLDDRIRVREKMPNALGKFESSITDMFIQSEYKNKLGQDRNAGLSSGSQ